MALPYLSNHLEELIRGGLFTQSNKALDDSGLADWALALIVDSFCKFLQTHYVRRGQAKILESWLGPLFHQGQCLALLGGLALGRLCELRVACQCLLSHGRAPPGSKPGSPGHRFISIFTFVYHNIKPRCFTIILYNAFFLERLYAFFSNGRVTVDGGARPRGQRHLVQGCSCGLTGLGSREESRGGDSEISCECG
jgi:hypothetical protein